MNTNLQRKTKKRQVGTLVTGPDLLRYTIKMAMHSFGLTWFASAWYDLTEPIKVCVNECQWL